MTRKRITTSELNSKIEGPPTVDSNMSPINEPARNGAEPMNNAQVASYSSLYTICQVIGLLLVSSVFYWIIAFRGGFGFSEPHIIFNWHPMLNTIAFMYLFANSILHFRTFRNAKKQDVKIQHAIIHGCTIILVLFAGWAAFASHLYSKPPIPNLYSLHSWLGVLTITMFLSQFIGGFVSFLYPGIAGQYRAAIMPYHVFFGVFNFALAVATSVLGFGEKLIFTLKDYSDFPNEGLFGNFLGILCVVFGGLVVYLVTKPEYKRHPKPESGVLLTGASE